MRLLPLLSTTVVFLLSACASPGPGTSRLATLDATSLGLAPASPAAPWPNQRWWTGLGDAQLNRLIEDALQRAPGLDAARARLAQAQALGEQTAASSTPQLAFNGNLERQQFSEHYLQPPPLAGNQASSGRLAMDGNWELDFFGKHRAELGAALSRTRAAEHEQQAVRLALAAAIASSYVQLDSAWQALDLAQTTLRQRETSARIAEQRAAAGLEPLTASRQAAAASAAARQQIEALHEHISLLQHQLAALGGYRPQQQATLTRPHVTLASTPLPDSLPAELLARRPDIAALRERITASGYLITAAHTRFYPNINLAGFAGLQAIGLSHLLDSSSQIAGIGPALHLPIFDGGRLRASLHQSEADYDAAVAQYNAQVIDAMHEVADALVSSRSLQRQQDEQQRALAELQAARHIADLRFSHGLGNRLAPLAAEERVLTLQGSTLDLALRTRLSWIKLNRALGGGFGAAPAPGTEPTPDQGAHS